MLQKVSKLFLLSLYNMHYGNPIKAREIYKEYRQAGGTKPMDGIALAGKVVVEKSFKMFKQGELNI